MSRFEDAARAYCKGRVEWLRLKAECKKLPCTGSLRFDEQECWMSDPDDPFYATIDGWCDNCNDRAVLVEQRRDIGRTLSVLARSMYAAYREEDD